MPYEKKAVGYDPTTGTVRYEDVWVPRSAEETAANQAKKAANKAARRSARRDKARAARGNRKANNRVKSRQATRDSAQSASQDAADEAARANAEKQAKELALKRVQEKLLKQAGRANSKRDVQRKELADKRKALLAQAEIAQERLESGVGGPAAVGDHEALKRARNGILALEAKELELYGYKRRSDANNELAARWAVRCARTTSSRWRRSRGLSGTRRN